MLDFDMAAPLFDENIAAFLRNNQLIAEQSQVKLIALSGGVSSDIWKVECGRECFVVKRALPQLRVSQVWTAPISRNASEVDWMIEAKKVAPAAVPDILASDRQAGLFAMEYLDPGHHPVWKEELRKGKADPHFAAEVGATLGAIHAATAGSPDIAERFANDATFQSIRIEPYIEATARVHPELGGILIALGESTLKTKQALVHGDVSPKNILVGPQGPVFLDAECAWYGDPAFDLAFCLNHLLLKCVLTPKASDAFLSCFEALTDRYLAGVAWESSEELEQRAARLLPALLLARVDGKSPVEYISSEADKDRVRGVACPLIAAPPRHLKAIGQIWAKEILA